MKYGLLGENIDYSLSPKIHGEFFAIKNIEASYNLIDINSCDLDNFMKEEIFSYDGINVTIPYKQEVIKYLDFVSDTAKALNSVNTICVRDGKLHGYNTDILGFSSMMSFENISFSNKDVVILGTGATSSMVAYYATKRKAKTVTFVSRDKKENTSWKNYLTYDDEIYGDILINTTPCEARDVNNNSPLSENSIKSFKTIIDVNYAPYRNTLLKYGIYQNKKVVSGLYMLVAQAMEAEKLFGNTTACETLIRDIYKTLMKEKNIVIIGLTGTGKSTVGKVLAKATNRQFIDLDKYLVEQEGKSVSELFEISEQHFRECETKYLKMALENDGIVLSTGGGIVLKEENMNHILENSIVINIYREIDDILKTLNTKNRPLLQGDTENKLQEIYDKRKDLYNKYCEFNIANMEIKSTVKDIMIRIKGI